MPPERLGLLGGTFDPPHSGHLEAALICRERLGLDRVLLVVANQPWQKVGRRAVTDPEVRYAMVSAMVSGLSGLEACRIELDRGGPSYTVETVEQLRRSAARAGRPEPEIALLVGADLVETLPTWERVDELQALVTLAVIGRPGSPDRAVPAGWRAVQVDGPGKDVSSSDVRAMVGAGRPIDGLVPEPVIRCIERRNLYAEGR